MKKIVDQSREIKKKIDSLEFDVHWYRRVFHTFGAAFLVYYILPNDIEWLNLAKFWVPLSIVIFAILLEYLRISGKIDSKHFFGLRMYEKNRAGSYVFFAVGILLLLLLRFPQQIAIPCILCACIADPIMGEVRHRFEKKYVYITGFVVCLLFFMITWYKAAIWLMLLVSIVGAAGAVIGEAKKFWWLDDDFMIQMLPAIFLLAIWLSAQYIGIALPEPIIYLSLVKI